MATLSVKVIEASRLNQENKKEHAELHHFKYGLFSVDAWKEQLSQIISEEIDKLYLTRKTENTLKTHLEKQLEILIDKINARVKKQNEKTANGRFKQSLINSFVDVDEIKKGIPEYSAAILAEMSSSKTESQIKGLLKDRITSYMNKTHDVQPKTYREEIIEKYSLDEAEAKTILSKKTYRTESHIKELSWLIILIAVVLFLIEIFSRGKMLRPQYYILAITLLIMLAVGVTTPMIDMEAKISSFSFVLFDHPIKFENQILYFQSKSVLDVFHIMIVHKEIQMKLVGVLMVSFSVVFPLLKMLSSLVYYYDFKGARKRKLIQFFVLKSGKWSMADVMVVAIFMSFIGFNGILNSQLDQMKKYSETVDLITTNGTSLQPGFYLFFVYVLLALVFTTLLKSRSKDEHP
jgi:hypothetical protein